MYVKVRLALRLRLRLRWGLRWLKEMAGDKGLLAWRRRVVSLLTFGLALLASRVSEPWQTQSRAAFQMPDLKFR